MPHWPESAFPWYEMIGRLLLAVICGAIVGYDREHTGHAAGFRTHILIALGAAAFTLVAVCMFEAFDRRYSGHPPVDPFHIMSAVVGGVGFLGAGAILHRGSRVAGITTAAGMWTVAAIGVAAGAGLYLLAASVTAIAFITLALAKVLYKPSSHVGDIREARSSGKEKSPP